MKVSLVVASGAHQGKVIPVAVQQFLIGRDPQCQLRPASQSISKQHCALLLKNKTVYLKDFASTNGTFLNDQQVEPETEIAIATGDRVRVGPLDFTVEIAFLRPSDSTPLPEDLQLAGGSATNKLRVAAGSKAQLPALKKVEPVPGGKQPIPGPEPTGGSESDDDIAAMMLGLGDDSASGVPEGSTVFEMNAVNPDGTPKAEDAEAKKAPTREDSSNAASDILRKYMRRPR